MRLLDLVEQQHAVWVLIDAIGEQSALIITNIAWRRADETADRVTLHIFRHVETQQLHAHNARQLTGNFRLTNTGRTREQIATNWLVRFTQTSTCKLNRRRQRLNGIVLTIDHTLQINFQTFQRFGVRLGDLFRRNARHFRNDGFNRLNVDLFHAFVFRLEPLAGTRLVDHIDGLIGQLAIRHVTRR